MTNFAISNITADNVTDLYAQLLQVKSGRRGSLQITKKHAKANGIEWSFVENSCEILGLKLTKDNGRIGYTATRA